MNKEIFNYIILSKASVIIFDIDGTVKDLCIEHEIALRTTLSNLNVGRVNNKLIMLLNRIGMAIIKMGIFPTNRLNQKLLVKVFSIIAGVRADLFFKEYYENYTNQICLFDGITELLDVLVREKKVYFATLNKQNYNMELCGISQDNIFCTEASSKKTTYARILKQLNVSKQDVIVVGDNVFDDFLSAKRLGLRFLLVNNYNSKLKKILCRWINGK